MRRFAGAAAGLVLALCAGAVAAQSLETLATTPAEPLLIESVVRNADGSAVTAREALVEGPPLSEPTTGFVEGDSFVFVSRSQWTDFGPDGKPTSAAPAPAVISRLSLAIAGSRQ